MKESDFNDNRIRAMFETITEVVGGNKGFRIHRLISKAQDIQGEFTDDLNNLIGTYLSIPKDMEPAEKAKVLNTLAAKAMLLCVQYVAFIHRMGGVLSLLIDDSEDLLNAYQELCEEHPDMDKPGMYSSFLAHQFLGARPIDDNDGGHNEKNK